ncbi:MAG: DUF2007 domain-containing protein [Bacteroidales bacterium]|nr:DUF2007 domain-containing protein [Candidatus Cryptobacteroides faecihippi]MCQ2162744.1 DUF2007 domain-containing protein [Bacteroidales bacterium]
MEEFKTVATFYDPVSAQITAGMLMENGIPAGVFGNNSSYISLNFVNQIEVKVNAEDYDAALALIKQSEEQELSEGQEQD